MLKDYRGSHLNEHATFITDIARSLSLVDDRLVSRADRTSVAKEIDQLELKDLIPCSHSGEGMGLENTSPVFTIGQGQVEPLIKFPNGQPAFSTPLTQSMKEFQDIGLQESRALQIEGDKTLELKGGKHFKEGIFGYANKKAFVRAALQFKYKNNLEEGLKNIKNSPLSRKASDRTRTLW